MLWTGVLLLACLLPNEAAAGNSHPLKMDEAVRLAVARSRDLIAARLEVQAAEVERIAARFYPNPVFSYTLGNVVLGSANSQGMNVSPGAFGQTIHTFALSDVVDVWFKRSKRTEVADLQIEYQKLQVEDVLREVVHTVRSSYADVVREQEERRLAQETRQRFDETVRISRARYKAGDISEAELKKIELEGFRYQTAESDAELQLDMSRQGLASLLLFNSSDELPEVDEANPARKPYAVQELTQRALKERPDVRALRLGQRRAASFADQQAREAYPDISLGVAYTRDFFTVSGDNPHSLAFSLSLPLPLFDRNQAGIAHAEVEGRKADSDVERNAIEVRREVAQAVLRSERTRRLLEAHEGGMLERAENALSTAEKSFKAGAVSLLELLEAQRTHLETRAQYLKTMADYRQAAIDVAYAVGADL